MKTSWENERVSGKYKEDASSIYMMAHPLFYV